MLRARHHEPFRAADLLVKSLHPLGRNRAPQLRTKPDDEVHPSRGGARFTDIGDRRRELLALLRVTKVELEVRMRGSAKSENSSLGRVHDGHYKSPPTRIVMATEDCGDQSAIAVEPPFVESCPDLVLRTTTLPPVILSAARPACGVEGPLSTKT